MEHLPPYVATADEPVPIPYHDQSDGPDLRIALPLSEILEDLHRFTTDEDVVGYVDRFREHLAALGVCTSIMIDRDGAQHLTVGGACDAQIRHRSRYTHFLFEDLDRERDRRLYLIKRLLDEGRFADNRAPNPRLTTVAIRDFLQVDGRILMDPAGKLTEGGGIPRAFSHGTPDEAAECERASKAYFAMRRRWRSDRQIKRAVRILGKRTPNGWLVLEAHHDGDALRSLSREGR
jgi:hypothetical protein